MWLFRIFNSIEEEPTPKADGYFFYNISKKGVALISLDAVASAQMTYNAAIRPKKEKEKKTRDQQQKKKKWKIKRTKQQQQKCSIKSAYNRYFDTK